MFFMNKFKRKAVSALVSAVSLFSVPALTISVMPTVSATPSEQRGINVWEVWGWNDLEGEKGLARNRNCPQGINAVIRIIEECQRTGRHLKVTLTGFNTFIYSFW